MHIRHDVLHTTRRHSLIGPVRFTNLMLLLLLYSESHVISKTGLSVNCLVTIMHISQLCKFAFITLSSSAY